MNAKTALWVASIVVLVGPPVVLWKYQEQYTPVVETLLNALLFVLALQLGRIDTVSDAVKQANAKWLPQATSACIHLLTVCASVRTFRTELATTCTTARNELPELEQDKLKAVRTMLASHCNHGSARLNDFANHLDDAIEDWLRFIGANCQGDECERITVQIERRREELRRQFQERMPVCEEESPGWSENGSGVAASKAKANAVP